MEQYNLSENLLETKIRDYQLNSAMMPKKARILSKLFAGSFGKFAGNVLSVYDQMYTQIQEGRSAEEIKASVRREVSNKSRVSVKFPLFRPKQARICGLVAMNYSGFFDSEVELYSALMSDLRTGRAPVEGVVEQSRKIGITNPQKYGDLLEQKQQAIYDFGILMGLVDDNERFDELKEGMREGFARYFDRVASMHKGGLLGISWPLPLKKFSFPIKEGLRRDTITHAIQEGIGNDYGFLRPEEREYDLIIKQIKETAQNVASKRNSFLKKWILLRSLPATLFFLSGMNAAYASETGKTSSDYIGAGITAATTAASIADDSEDFITTWITTFTTLV